MSESARVCPGNHLATWANRRTRPIYHAFIRSFIIIVGTFDLYAVFTAAGVGVEVEGVFVGFSRSEGTTGYGSYPHSIGPSDLLIF